MELEDLVQPEGLIAHLKVTSKKQALQELAERAAKLTGLSERAIFETLLERERLGSTGSTGFLRVSTHRSISNPSTTSRST